MAEPHNAAAGPSSSPARPASPTTRGSAEAGPSRIAPYRHLPKLAYGAIEYPGPVSQPGAILGVTSQREINDCFNSPGSDNALLEINYRADQSGGPIRGYRVPSQKLLVKIVKRRRKDGQGGVFTSEVIGPVNQTVRFRSMADWHYTPNADGPTQDLLTTLKKLDYEGILDYRIPDLHEEYTIPTTPELGKEPDPELSHRSLLDLQPLPLFSERRLPLVYNYRQTHASAVMEYQDPITGEIKQRLHNTSRVHGFAPIAIGHHHPLGEVPKEAEPKIKGKIPKLNKDLLDKMKRIFEERPVWMRAPLLAQFTPDERRAVVDSKSYIPACAYMFGAGPYWKCYSRFGYDPRQHAEAKIYQRTYFYITAARANAKPIFETPEPGEEDEEPVATDKTAHEAWAEKQARRIEAGERPPLDKSREHIFDGQILDRDRPDYQLCDITDPLIKKYIEDPRIVTDTCDPRSGWYTATGMEMIREMIKAKYVHVRDHDEPAPDKLCYPMIQALEGSIDQAAKDQAEAQSGDADVDMAED